MVLHQQYSFVTMDTVHWHNLYLIYGLLKNSSTRSKLLKNIMYICYNLSEFPKQILILYQKVHSNNTHQFLQILPKGTN